MKPFKEFMSVAILKKVSNKVAAEKIIKTINSSKTLEHLKLAKTMRDKWVKALTIKPIFGDSDDELWSQMDKALDNTKKLITQKNEII